MPKQSSLRVRSTTQEGYRFQVSVPPKLNDGKRARKFFYTRKEAQQFVDDLRVRHENFGTRLAQMPERLRHEALECVRQLEPFAATLTEATKFFIQHKIATGQSCTVPDLIAKVLEVKKLGARAKRYLLDLRRIGGSFAALYPDKFVLDVTPGDVEVWAAVRGCSPTTINNRLRTLSSAFSYAVKRGWCQSNPIDRVERATERKPVARYLTAKQARTLLQHADHDMVPCVAIQLFAGLRPCEMAEMPFKNIDLELDQLWVDKEEHTTSHRVVKIEPNLREWLLPYRGRTGMVQPPRYQKRWDNLRRWAGLYANWPHDGLRHSYGTWHHAMFQDLGKTASQMGHSNQGITRKHYVVREDPSRATEYWSITPATVAAMATADVATS